VADVNANIDININSGDAIASLHNLQNRITEFNNSVIKGNASAVAAQRNLLSTLNAQIGVAGQFSTSVANVESSVTRLGTAIDKNKLSLGEYFRYGAASTKTFGRVFAQEHNAIMDLASERVKKLQTQYIALEKTQNGATKAMAVRPMSLFNADAALAIQKQQLFNKLLHDGSTSLINFGKNTQWAGRQLMVGFTLPLAAFGMAASKTFMDLDKQARDFKRVYGDAFTPPAEIQQNLDAVQKLGKEYTKYGISLKDTMTVAATAAAAGMKNEKLTGNTEQALRLATVGQIDYQQALTTTITLQNAFKISNEQLGPTVDFIGAVANQTVLSVDDLTNAIPRVAPVIQGLGGDVKDLAVMLVAMKEGGVSAEQGANALKSGLASLINPTKAGAKAAAEFGINIKGIVQANKGDLMGTVQAFGAALSKLDEFSRQQVLEKVFGKYQFARIGALFDNINEKTGQVKQSMDLLGMSTQDLAAMSDKSLNQIAESTTAKFQSAVEQLKIAIAPIGEIFLKVAAPILEFATKLIDKFNDLSPNVKQFITILGIGLGVVTPVAIMLVGLIANFAGNAIKGFSLMNGLINKIKGGGSIFKYMSTEELDAAAAASSLEGKTNKLTSALNVQREAVMGLAASYESYIAAANAAAGNLPQGFRQPVRRMAAGGIVPGSGNGDTVPALLTPGESVINKKATQRYAPMLAAMNAGTLKGYAQGYIDVGNGETVRLDVAQGAYDDRSGVQQGSAAAIQRMFDSISGMGAEIKNEFVQILRDLQAQEKVSAKTVKDILAASSHPELRSLAQDKRYSRPASLPSIEEQLVNERGRAAATREIITAQNSANAAAQAMRQNAEEFGITEGQIADAMGISRSHMIELSKGDKVLLEAWHSSLWETTSQAENQMSNLLATQDKNKQVFSSYLKNLSEDVASEETKKLLMEKITKNQALTEKEYRLQAQVLENILNDIRIGALATGSVTPAFAPYAVGTVAAAKYREQNNVIYGGRSAVDTADAKVKLESARLANSGVSTMENELVINSPSERAAAVGDSIDEGVAEGIRRSSNEPIQAAADMVNQARDELDNLQNTEIQIASEQVPQSETNIDNQNTANVSPTKEAAAKMRSSFNESVNSLKVAFNEIPKFGLETIKAIKPVFIKLGQVFLELNPWFTKAVDSVKHFFTQLSYTWMGLKAFGIESVNNALQKAKSAYETAMLKTMYLWDSAKNLPNMAKSAYETAMLKTIDVWNSVKGLPNKVKDTFTSTMNKLPVMFESFKEKISRVLQIVANPVPRSIVASTVIDVSQRKLSSVLGQVSQALNPIKNKITEFGNIITVGAKKISMVAQLLADPLGRAVVISTFTKMGLEKLNIGLQTLSQKFEPVKSAFNSFVSSVRLTATKISQFAQMLANPLARAIIISTMTKKLELAFSNIVSSVKTGSVKIYNALLSGAQSYWSAIKQSAIKSAQNLSSAWDTFRLKIMFAQDKIARAFTAANIKQAIINAGKQIKDAATSGAQNIKTSLINAARSMGSVGKFGGQMISGYFNQRKVVGQDTEGNDIHGDTRGQRMARAANNAAMGLSAVAMAAAMVPGPIGEMAQKMMPVSMGLMSLQMMLPMFTSPLGIAILALTAIAGSMVFFKSKADEASASAQKLADAMISTQSSVDKVGEFYSKKSLATKQSEDVIKKQAQVGDADVEKAKQFVQSDIGKSMQEGLSMAISKFGESQASKQFAANLSSMVLQGVMSPEEARAAAAALGQAVGNETIGLDINGKLKELLGPDNSNLLENPLKLTIEINNQNEKTVQTVTSDIDNLSAKMKDFNKTTAGDMASMLIPVFGQVNLINKLALSQDNWFGQVARSARGILNTDDFEKTEANLKQIGSLVGNSLAQAYDNLSAAKARYKEISDKVATIDPKDNDAKVKAKEQADQAKKDLDAITSQIQQQQATFFNAFSNATDQAKVTMIEGIRESITKQFENDPGMKMAWEVISGEMGDVSQNVQFNIDLAISSGQLNPLGVQNLMSFFDNPIEATASINFIITTYGLDMSNKMILDIINIKDPQIRKEAIIDLIVNTPGGIDSKTLANFGPEGVVAANQANAKKQEGPSGLQKSIIASKKLHLETAQENLYTYEGGLAYTKTSKQEKKQAELKQKVKDAEEEYKNAVTASTAVDGRQVAMLKEKNKAILPLIISFKSLKDKAQSTTDVKINIDENNLSKDELDRVNEGLTIFNQFPPDSVKILDIKTIGSPEQLASLTEQYKALESQDPKVVKEVIVNVLGKDGVNAKTAMKQIKDLGYSLNDFAKLDNTTKTAILFNLDVQAKLNLEISSLESLIASVGSGSSVSGGLGSKLSVLKSQLGDFEKFVKSFAKDSTADNSNPSPNGSGSKSNPMKDLMDSLLLKAQQYNDLGVKAKDLFGPKASWRKNFEDAFLNNGLSQVLRKAKMPETMIADLMSKGADGIKLAFTLLNKNKNGLNSLGQKMAEVYQKIGVGTLLNNFQQKIDSAKLKSKSESFLGQLGFSQEDVKTLSLSEEEMKGLIDAYNKGGSAISNVTQKFKEFLATQSPNTLESLQSSWLKYADVVDAAFDLAKIEKTTQLENEFLTINGKTTDEMHHQIDANNKLIEQEQTKIDKKQEQINSYQHENDMTQQHIDDLNREVEMRNRVSDAISHDLDVLSQQENAIKKTYDERIKALTTVANLNQHIAEQQQNQLNVAKAFSEGDIYAAAQAANQMSQANAKYAQEQQQTALEQGMNNAVGGLRTQGGLTKDQAEQKIANIKEQNYQVSLQIRQEEDKIYANNLLIRDLNNEIYTIQNGLMKTYEQQNKDYQITLQNHSADLDYALNHLTAAGMTQTEWDNAKKNQQALVDSIKNNASDLMDAKNAYEAIANALERAKINAQGLSNVPTPSSTINNSMPGAGNRGSGTGMLMYAGGMVVKKYAAGGHVGMDSFSAMLTPGEFVMRTAAVKKYGANTFSSMNMGALDMPKYSLNNKQMSLPVQSGSNISNISAPVYNTYSINVPVNQPGASADEIANKVIMKIKHIEGAAVRGNRGY
jgi:TP901 family phage tail tape measure protein